MSVLAAGSGWRQFMEQSIIAGLIAGTTVELFLFITHVASWPATYQWIASGVIGKTAFTSTSYAWLGLSLHGVISIVWASIFVAGAKRLPVLVEMPVLFGLLYGVIVFIGMQIVTMIAKIWAPPSAALLTIFLIDHIVFFGLPVALYVARAMRQEPLPTPH